MEWTESFALCCAVPTTTGHKNQKSVNRWVKGRIKIIYTVQLWVCEWGPTDGLIHCKYRKLLLSLHDVAKDSCSLGRFDFPLSFTKHSKEHLTHWGSNFGPGILQCLSSWSVYFFKILFRLYGLFSLLFSLPPWFPDVPNFLSVFPPHRLPRFAPPVSFCISTLSCSLPDCLGLFMNKLCFVFLFLCTFPIPDLLVNVWPDFAWTLSDDLLCGSLYFLEPCYWTGLKNCLVNFVSCSFPTHFCLCGIKIKILCFVLITSHISIYQHSCHVFLKFQKPL